MKFSQKNCEAKEHNKITRLKNFKEWKSVYGADYAQPEPSHWYPFLMAIGAAKEDKAEFIYRGYQFGLITSIIPNAKKNFPFRK